MSEDAPTFPVALAEHVAEMVMLAWDLEPDWDAVFEGAGHSWCTEVSDAIVAYLAGHGVESRTRRGGLRGNWHAWVALADGTIIDATIGQYIDGTLGCHIDDGEVPWVVGPGPGRGGHDPGGRTSADAGAHGTSRLAVVPAGHPFHGEYDVDESSCDDRAMR